MSRLESVVCVMPRTSTEWAGAAAMWITAAGWAAAAERSLGAGWVVTPDCIATPAQTLQFTEPKAGSSSAAGNGARGRAAQLARRVPTVAVTGVKDARRLVAARRFARTDLHGPWESTDVRFVWQHHDLFHRTGERLAGRLGCPIVSYVHAPQVWEASKWGVARPGWGRSLERFGERPQLLVSDVVACVSDEVSAELMRLGVEPSRIVVAPMAVDPDRFNERVDGGEVRQRFGLGENFVVGWTGSFRQFHGLEGALEAFVAVHAARPDSKLLLVGDGAERSHLEDQARRSGIGDAVVFTGAIGAADIPRYVAAMDAALVVAREGEQFHYSPLKLREYLACGVPVVGPRLGEVARLLGDEKIGRLYRPGDPVELAEQIVGLIDDDAERARMARAGSEWVAAHGTWDAQLELVLTTLARLGR
jgi:glycosyltransferase involved in cell wall biosynthesis